MDYSMLPLNERATIICGLNVFYNDANEKTRFERCDKNSFDV